MTIRLLVFAPCLLGSVYLISVFAPSHAPCILGLLKSPSLLSMSNSVSAYCHDHLQGFNCGKPHGTWSSLAGEVGFLVQKLEHHFSHSFPFNSN